ncbi:hypothetical protein DPMN_168849 [Dreissena polymorpha]|uniref:Uncharacterized protein n=1 Tax=Dreissena polymorpha TaxID=45954 RepID=A0A9D4F1F6_DREPO|nr:hypothetical protein DPMN_168849 [Dreissena polymorpha]
MDDVLHCRQRKRNYITDAASLIVASFSALVGGQPNVTDDIFHCRQRTDGFFQSPYLELYTASRDLRLQVGYLGGQLGLYLFLCLAESTYFNYY